VTKSIRDGPVLLCGFLLGEGGEGDNAESEQCQAAQTGRHG
jgi:hypothetical protein